MIELGRIEKTEAAEQDVLRLETKRTAGCPALGKRRQPAQLRDFTPVFTIDPIPALGEAQCMRRMHDDARRVVDYGPTAREGVDDGRATEIPFGNDPRIAVRFEQPAGENAGRNSELFHPVQHTAEVQIVHYDGSRMSPEHFEHAMMKR